MFKSHIVTGPKKALNKKDSRLFWESVLRGSSNERGQQNITESKCVGYHDMSIVFANDDAVGVRVGKCDFIPSLYTIWRYSAILPRIYVHSALTHYLLGGAHLMLPGISRVVASMPNSFSKNEIVSIYCIGNPMAVAVGRALYDRDQILAAPVDQKGKAVDILHFFGDHLWLLGSKAVPAGFDYDRIHPVNNTEAPVVLTKSFHEEQDGPPSILTSSEMDSLAWGSLYEVLKNIEEKDLPMDSSALYSKMQLAARTLLNSASCRKRIGLNSGNASECKLDLKTSSWRNFKSFLSEIKDKNLLSIKSVRGDSFIMSLNKEHPDVRAFVSPKPISTYQDEQTAQLVKIWYSLDSSWSIAFGAREGSRKELMELLSEYLRSVKGAFLDLADHENLREALRSSSSIVEKKDIMVKYSDALIPMYSMKLEVPPRVRRGCPPKIAITLKRVSGNKLSTTIKGLTQYAIDEQEMAAALSRQLSVSVSLVEGGLYCQGDLREKLVKYLSEKVGIPKECIAVKN